MEVVTVMMAKFIYAFWRSGSVKTSAQLMQAGGLRWRKKTAAPAGKRNGSAAMTAA